nr:unnamed protein product [Callosobruchus chinensis]
MSAVLISIDYSKAFDKINHNLLCAKLNYIGFDSLSVCFFKNYLSNRNQCVSLNGQTSNVTEITSGVPQGSILGPLLFLIYTFDLHKSIVNSDIQTFADDTQVIHYFNSDEAYHASRVLQADLDKICKFSHDHNLDINPDKTKVLMFCSDSERDHITASFALHISGVLLNHTQSAKILGVEIDNKLRFIDHIKKITQKTYSRLRMLYANRYLLNFKMRKKLCEALILSIYSYCDILYYPCLNQLTKNRLQILQNNCIRFIFGLRKYDHVTDKYIALKWLKMSDLTKYHYLIFIKKLLTLAKPEYLREKIIFSNEIHDRSLRYRDTIRIPHHCSTMFKRSFSYNAAIIYNSVETIHKKLSLSKFRKTVKNLLLANAI